MRADQSTLAGRLRAAADRVELRVDALDDRRWNAFIESEQRTVGQLVAHIAWAWQAECAAFRAIADGASGSGWTQEWLDTQNAEQARISATRPRSEIMERFRTARDHALSFVEQLGPTELQRIGQHMPGEPARTVAGWIETCLIGHPLEHLPEIENATSEQSDR